VAVSSYACPVLVYDLDPVVHAWGSVCFIGIWWRAGGESQFECCD
jgi:hypothetical protein